jgi:hypothetical protein
MRFFPFGQLKISGVMAKYTSMQTPAEMLIAIHQ